MLLLQTPCSSSPCQNGGTCLANYKEDTYHCLCGDGFIGTYCEKGKHFFFLQTLGCNGGGDKWDEFQVKKNRQYAIMMKDGIFWN